MRQEAFAKARADDSSLLPGLTQHYGHALPSSPSHHRIFQPLNREEPLEALDPLDPRLDRRIRRQLDIAHWHQCNVHEHAQIRDRGPFKGQPLPALEMLLEHFQRIITADGAFFQHIIETSLRPLLFVSQAIVRPARLTKTPYCTQLFAKASLNILLVSTG